MLHKPRFYFLRGTGHKTTLFRPLKLTFSSMTSSTTFTHGVERYTQVHHASKAHLYNMTNILDISFRCPYHEFISALLKIQFQHNHGQELHNFERVNSGFSNLNWFITIKKLAFRSIGEKRPQAIPVGFGGSL